MAPPKLHVREIQPSPSDLDSLIRLVMAAFAGTRLHRLVFPNPILVDGFNVEEHVWRVGHVTRSLSDTTRHHVVVVEETEVDGVKHEEYAGYAVWQNPPDSDTPEKTPEERERDKQEAMSHWPPSMDKENMKMLIEESEKLEKQCLGDVHGDGAKNFWILQVLAVDPKHQRKGVGKLLTRWGIDEAAKNEKDVCLIASPRGRLLYTSLGFDVVSEFQTGDEVHTGMRRDETLEG